MSYLVLARKYRPRTFREVAGQEVPMRVLQGALQEDRVGHAYLFCGPRGTGKTTTARILAKALNCERGPTAEPCGECLHCRGIDAGSDVDVIEIDAASNNGVDDVRDLRERVAYAPMKARFKIYIVDEVHMLSKAANNALLKTLEEPPAHVKFLFATTEPQRLLDTVRSRCQIVQLSLIREETIATHLRDILAKEGLTSGEGVVEELARRARGSMRDALSLTDQMLALVEGSATLEDVRRLGGSGGSQFVDELLTRVEEGDRAGVVTALVQGSAGAGGEAELCTALLDHLRGALLGALAPQDALLFECEPSERQRRTARAARLGVERLETWLEELLAARERMAHLEAHAGLLLELTLLDLSRPEVNQSLAELEQRLLALESRLANAPARVGPALQPASPPAGQSAAPPASPPASRSAGQPSRPSAGSAAGQPVAQAPVRNAARPAVRPAPGPSPGLAPGLAPGSSPGPGATTARGAARVEPLPRDPFTENVADLFSGKVEES